MELEAENWRLCSTTLVRGVSGELEWKMRTGDYAEYLGSWKMRTGDFVVQRSIWGGGR